ncbi:N(4)-(beta-N-acetylglucosaminyl)-L-asparaginase [Tellurirhabdus bombi]|uniref:N(4)-(beta-N-acetylglucosaminyl)-L-asparaginase n=1 Tax=Tellurirhabdus bombi TaxID=2907205 RepID=UPI001F26289F|nr:N(4)-(beta-N-acetylglucosaminyl)-L-asparaginase [Tellurirhabdus bombi]
MISRRKLLASAAATAVLSRLNITKSFAAQPKPQVPLIISTWNNRGANEAGWAILNKKGRALDAVEAAARVPEADPKDTSVGYGGLPDRDGHVTLDACIMDEKGRAGSVTFMENIMHAISVARAVMEKTPHVMLAGEGAYQFALANGFKKENLLTENAKKAWEDWKKESKYKPVINIERHDTIGVLAIDAKNDLSGACTTSGLAFKMRGRVGDSPILGAGLYIDNEIGGACATGLGETVMRAVSSFLVVELMRQGKTPQQACEEAIRRLVKKTPEYKDLQVGILAVNRAGEHGAYSIHKGFNYTLSLGNETKVHEADHFIK